jgi:endogenous inhibitor of DNA gyrase (YacG/DUF329 family)
MTISVKCPVCGRAVTWLPAELYKPFCSERCKLIDLGEWADEGYKIPVKDENLDDGFTESDSSEDSGIH